MSYTIEELKELFEAQTRVTEVMEEPTEKGRTAEEVRMDIEALHKKLVEAKENALHDKCRQRIAYLEEAVRVRDEAECCIYCCESSGPACGYCGSAGDCLPRCPTVTHPLKGKGGVR